MASHGMLLLVDFSNALNGRNKVVKELSERYKVTAYGCLGSSERVDKIKLFSESKFCVAMENSNAKSYVSEKVSQLVP